MGNSVYHINKGINKSIEFKGLKAQYIWYFGGGIVVLMILFSMMYFIGFPSFISLGIIGIAGTVMAVKIYKMSHKYGEHGMMKELAKRQLPTVVKTQSRRIYKIRMLQ